MKAAIAPPTSVLEPTAEPVGRSGSGSSKGMRFQNSCQIKPQTILFWKLISDLATRRSAPLAIAASLRPRSAQALQLGKRSSKFSVQIGL